MTKPHNPEEILYAFAVEPNHDRATLERYLSRYPGFAEELIDLSSQLRLSKAIVPSPAVALADAGSEAAWREYLVCSPKAVTAGEAVDLFAPFRGETFVSVAEELNVPRSFLMAVRDGLVTAASVPDRFVGRLAQAMNVPVEAIRLHFANPRASLAARAFKSDGKPAHQGQISFLELVDRTEMTDEQRELLMQDCVDDGLS